MLHIAAAVQLIQPLGAQQTLKLIFSSTYSAPIWFTLVSKEIKKFILSHGLIFMYVLTVVLLKSGFMHVPTRKSSPSLAKHSVVTVILVILLSPTLGKSNIVLQRVANPTRLAHANDRLVKKNLQYVPLSFSSIHEAASVECFCDYDVTSGVYF